MERLISRTRLEPPRPRGRDRPRRGLAGPGPGAAAAPTGRRLACRSPTLAPPSRPGWRTSSARRPRPPCRGSNSPMPSGCAVSLRLDGDLPPTLSVVALYDDAAGTIFLPGTGRIDAAQMSILVHDRPPPAERVRTRLRLPRRTRGRGLRAQERWLALSGETLAEAFELTPPTLFVLTSCGREPHSLARKLSSASCRPRPTGGAAAARDPTMPATLRPIDALDLDLAEKLVLTAAYALFALRMIASSSRPARQSACSSSSTRRMWSASSYSAAATTASPAGRRTGVLS